MCHFDVVLSKNFLQGFGECGVERYGDVEGEVWSPSGGLLRSGRGEVSVVCFVHNSTNTLIRQKCLTVCNSASRFCGSRRCWLF